MKIGESASSTEPGAYAMAPAAYTHDDYPRIVEAIAAQTSTDRTLLQQGGLRVEETIYDGQRLIVRTPNRNHSQERAAMNIKVRTNALFRGIGTAGLEQTIGYSTQARIVLSRHAGPTIRELTPETVSAITVSDFERLYETFLTMPALGLYPDTYSLNNCTYTPNNGFTAIDYRTVEKQDEIDIASPELHFMKFLEQCTDPRKVPGRYYSAWVNAGRMGLEACERVSLGTDGDVSFCTDTAARYVGILEERSIRMSYSTLE